MGVADEYPRSLRHAFSLLTCQLRLIKIKFSRRESCRESDEIFNPYNNCPQATLTLPGQISRMIIEYCRPISDIIGKSQ